MLTSSEDFVLEDVGLIEITSSNCTISLELNSRVKKQLLWLSNLNFSILYKNSVMFNVEVLLVNIEFENEKLFGEVKVEFSDYHNDYRSTKYFCNACCGNNVEIQVL